MPTSYTLAMPLTLIYDDGRPLSPLTDLRPVFDVRTGVATTRERWEGMLGRTFDAVGVPERLRELCAETSGVGVNPDLSRERDVLIVNGACVLPAATTHFSEGEWLADVHGHFVAGRVDGSAATDLLQGITPSALPASIADDGPLIERVSDVIRLRDRAIELDLHHVAPAPCGPVPDNVHHFGDKPVVLGEGCCVGPGAVLDASSGPIYVATGATVRPRATLIGPCAVLEHATVMDGALVRANTVVGPRCKVGGEVGGSIFQGYANKAHDGYLGDSYVGEWVNIGAGTNNSNLLNTYGVVKSAPHLHAERSATGLTFFGCVLGDHAKTAIGSRLMTGTLVGTGAMCASAEPPPHVADRFLWLTDAGPSRYRWAKFEEVARAVMKRRDVTPSGAYVRALRDLHEGDEA